MIELPKMPEPTVKVGEYAGPPGEGVSERLWNDEALQAHALKAVMEERERCEKLALEMASENVPIPVRLAYQRIERAIRNQEIPK